MQLGIVSVFESAQDYLSESNLNLNSFCFATESDLDFPMICILVHFPTLLIK